MSIHQKLGMILEHEVAQKLNLEKNDFTKKLIYKIDFESMILALFDKP